MPTSVNINEFLKLSETHPILDVRTPAEYNQGHIVGAINLPLFTNEERIIIGTLYKKEGKQPAVLKGLEIVGPKLHLFIQGASKIQNTGTLLLHCWRGGMRSSSMAWLFEAYGFKCITLKGGYKNYRNHVLESFSEQKNMVVLGGKTGTGKTIVLQELQNQGEQIIDLEKLACHKGSSFGSLGEKEQLSQEQFENELYALLSNIDSNKRCWVENESRRVGKNVIPLDFWNQMMNAYVVTIHLPIAERIHYLVKEYGKFTKEELIDATKRIAKRLGGQHAKSAIEAIEQGDLKTACEISLVYYDKTYKYGEENRKEEKIKHFEFDTLDVKKISREIKLWKK